MKISNRVLVTVTLKNNNVKLFNKWMLTLLGDLTDMFQLQKELIEVKKIVNREVNKKGLALRDVKVDIEFMQEVNK